MSDEKNTDTIRVLLVKPGEKAEMVDMGEDLDSMQQMVGGMIEEYMPFEDDVAIVCNDEGKMRGMPLNRGIRGENGALQDIIAGPFFVCYAPIESEKFLSLPPEFEKKYEAMFRNPETFYQTPDGIIAISHVPTAREMER